MFWKKRKKEKVKYDVASENLAVPEVHTGEVEHTETDPQPDEPITPTTTNTARLRRKQAVCQFSRCYSRLRQC